jgi:hypothetical protein
MLYEKDRVKAKTKDSKEEFGWIPSNPTPVRFQCAVNKQLKQRHDASDKIEPNHIDGPTSCRLDFVVVPAEESQD